MKITRTPNLLAATVGLLAFITTIAWAADRRCRKVTPLSRTPAHFADHRGPTAGDQPGDSSGTWRGGFRYLMNNASGMPTPSRPRQHGDHRGHTTLATGADPAVHGMIGTYGWIAKQGSSPTISKILNIGSHSRS